MREAAIRGARTFLQAFLGTFLAMTAMGGTGDVPGYATIERAAVAAGWAGLIALIAFAQNALEEATGHRGLK